MGCEAEFVATISELDAAYQRAKAADRTYVIALRTDAHSWTEGGAWWEVGVAEVSDRPAVREARAVLSEAKKAQRVGW